MPVHHARAQWNGNLAKGKGTMQLGKNGYKGEYSASSRFENGEGTSPEELIGAANAGCFSMALSDELAKAGYEPEEVHTEANVELSKVEGGFRITEIKLDVQAKVPGISEDEFMKFAEGAKENCPVSQALKATKITMNATLAS